MVAYQMVQIIIVCVLHTFQRVKRYPFHGFFACSSIQTVHVLMIKFVSVLQHPNGRPVMTIAVDLGRKATKQTKQHPNGICCLT